MNRENLRKSVHTLLASFAITPTFGRLAMVQELAVVLNLRFGDADEAGLREVNVVRAVQRDTHFALFVSPLSSEDPDQYCAALEDFIGSDRVVVHPYMVPGFPLPDSQGYVELGGSAEPDTYEVGTDW